MRYLTFLLLLLTAPAFADSIDIGTLSYLGPNAQGFSQYQVLINTNRITAAPIMFDIGIGTDQGSAELGPYNTTLPLNLLFHGGPSQGLPPCPCASIGFSVVFDLSSLPTTFLLANGKSFTPLTSTNSTILPLPGQTFILPGQSVPILITSVPEPATVSLMGIGMICLIAQWKRRPRPAAYSKLC